MRLRWRRPTSIKETLERLASLGYVATSASASGRRPRRSGPLADPKDKLDVFIAVQRAGELMSRDEHAEAARALGRLSSRSRRCRRRC